MKKQLYEPRIGDFVAKKIPDTDWVITGVIVDYYSLYTQSPTYKVLWSPEPRFPISSGELYESYENFEYSNIKIIRSEKDIPDDFLPAI
jgi:hypothetical protein